MAAISVARAVTTITQLNYRECGNYSDVHVGPIATYGRPTRLHFQLNTFWGFESELQTNPMPFHVKSLWGATLMPLRGRDVHEAFFIETDALSIPAEVMPRPRPSQLETETRLRRSCVPQCLELLQLHDFSPIKFTAVTFLLIEL